VDACVTTSEHAKRVHQRTLEGASRLPVELIEHGRDLEQQDHLWTLPPDEGPVRILVAGNITVSKGGDLIRRILEQDADGRLEFHFIGSMWPEYRDLGVNHGPYRREEFADRVRTIKPSFAGALSICGETYSHVLTEAWAAGLPVLANDIGTFGERVRRHGGGWLLDHTDPEGSYERILEICSDHDEYRRVAAEATAEDVPTTIQTARRYERLYREVEAARLSFAVPEPVSSNGAGGGPGPGGRGVLRVALALLGVLGAWPPSAHVRCLRPLTHPGVRARLIATGGALGAEAREGGSDALLVQRAALSRAEAELLLEQSRASAARVLLELDDDLLDGDGNAGEDANPAVRMLAAECDRVVVSTEPLREAARRLAGDVVVVPSMLDERLWLPPYSERPQNGASQPSDRGGPLRILYAGGSTHEPDLELIRPAIEALREGGGVELEVVGVGGPEAAADWYTPIPVPSGRHPYPLFATWLRDQAQRWDLAVAPLIDTPFNRCKSDLKLLEYGALGIPAVFSDVGVYDSCEHGETGLLAANTTEAWTEAIGSLLQDPGLRERIGRAAREYVVGERCLGSRPSAYLSALETA
jgi:glycosyltransferase involved in cell wall biosynthesis